VLDLQEPVMPYLDSTVVLLVLFLWAAASTLVLALGWIVRRGGVETISGVAEELHDTVHAVEFRAAKYAQGTINGIREINLDCRVVVRAGMYIFFASLMALLWLPLGSQVAMICEPAAVAFIKHGGEIATYKLHLYWNICMACDIVGFLLGLVVGEGVYILLRPLIKPERP
jgi:hypothetical protein